MTHRRRDAQHVYDACVLYMCGFGVPHIGLLSLWDVNTRATSNLDADAYTLTVIGYVCGYAYEYKVKNARVIGGRSAAVLYRSEHRVR